MRILVPVELMDQGFPIAARAAVQLARPDDEVQVLHLVTPPIQWYTDASGPPSPDVGRIRRSLQQALRSRGLPKAKVTVKVGDAAHLGDSIIEFAKEIEADLIVIPTHGRKGFSRLMLGSVAERVVRLAHCDVHVVRMPIEG